MWQKIKFFFLRRMSDEKLRMWCVERALQGYGGNSTYSTSVIADEAERLFNYVRFGVPYTPEW